VAAMATLNEGDGLNRCTKTLRLAQKVGWIGAISDQGWVMSTDGKGAIYVSGLGDSLTSSDAILFKLVDPGFLAVPEPTSVALGVMPLLLVGVTARRRRPAAIS
jgi:hypothetical protein